MWLEGITLLHCCSLLLCWSKWWWKTSLVNLDSSFFNIKREFALVQFVSKSGPIRLLVAIYFHKIEICRKQLCESVNCVRILVFSRCSILEWLLSVDTSSRLSSPCSVESICCIFTQFVLISSHLLSKLIYMSLIHISHCFIVQWIYWSTDKTRTN